MSRWHHLRKQKGVTLVELMIVLAIVGILAAVSIPLWGSYIPVMNLNGSARNLQLAMALARMKAVSRNRTMSVSITTNNFIIQEKEGGNWVNDTAKDKAVAGDLQSQGISLTSTFPSNRIIFNSRGMSIDTGGAPVDGTITLTNRDGKTRKVKVLGATGLANLES